MDIRGLQKTTLLDYPQKVACTVFVSGCNFRCPFCHNRDLVLAPTSLPRLPERDFFAFLQSRKSILDAVVVCGGEPTIHRDLEEFMGRIKSLRFLVKLDTNGSNPTVLRSAMEKGLVDYVALDVKAPLEEKAYAAAVGLVDFSGLSLIIESVRVLVSGGVGFELRTTVVPGLHDKESLVRLAKQLRDLVSALDTVPWYLQAFEPRECLDPAFTKVSAFSKAQLGEFLAAVQEIIPSVQLR